MRKLYVYLLSTLALNACQQVAEQQEEKKESVTIHTIGDSTMAQKKERARPETGWGECIINYVSDTSKVKVMNYAVNGRSSKSFIGEGRWDKVLANMKAGDYLFIQFGHNDQKEKDSTRYTNSSTMYKENLRRYVVEAREKGATPVLLTSIVRRNFNENGVLIDTHMSYPQAVREVAAEMDVLLIDAQLLTEKLVLAYGPVESVKLYNHVDVGHENYPDGKADDTHLNAYGACKIAGLIIEEMKNKDKSLAKLFK